MFDNIQIQIFLIKIFIIFQIQKTKYGVILLAFKEMVNIRDG